MELDLTALLSTFVAESEERITAMEEAILVLEDMPNDAAAAEHLLRIAHTLKGDAAILDLPAIIELAHVLEDVLERVGSRALVVTSELVVLLLQSVDALRDMVSEAAADELGPRLTPEHLALVKRLQESCAVVSTSGDGAAQSLDALRPEGASPTHGSGAGNRTLRIDIEKLDRMLNLAGEIAIARGRLGELLLDGAHVSDDALDVHRELEVLFGDLQELIMKARMVPIRPTFQRYGRMVHDVARARGKLAQLIIDDHDVAVDSTIVDRLRDPLTHLIRNAIDHGIEAPEVRKARGKPARGKITLRARHESGGILVEVQDDGGGLDKTAIVARARQQGLITGAESLSEGDTYALVFESGFSTATSVTELSGRGVGMDIVRRDIESVRGTIEIESEETMGTMISLHLPLTVALIDGLVVGVDTERYIIPIDAVVECVELTGAAKSEARGIIQLRGRALPYLRLRHAMGLGPPAGTRENIVVVRHGAACAGLAVDLLYGESQTVIKPLSRAFGRIHGVSGSSILSSGRVALILDVPGLLEAALADRMSQPPGLKQRSVQESAILR
jgi:two-component system chemotaxis sensor kinase CheA